MYAENLNIFGAIRFLHDSVQSAKSHAHYCMFPGCEGHAIESHSQSEGMSLSHISENGKVMCVANAPEKEFVTLSRTAIHASAIYLAPISKASTFRGFCGATYENHDKKCFANIEDCPLEVGRPDQVLSFWRRTWAYRIRAMEECCWGPSNLINDLVAINRNRPFVHPADVISRQVEALKRQYYADSWDDRFTDEISFEWIRVKGNIHLSDATIYPLINEQCEWLRNCDAKKRSYHIPSCVFCVVPKNDHSDLILMWRKDESEFMGRILDFFVSKSPPAVATVVNRLCFTGSKSFCMEPAFWRALSKEKQDAVIDGWAWPRKQHGEPSIINAEHCAST